jgi:uncharacterized protein YcaQ
MTITLADLRLFTVARNFFKPTTLRRALHKLAFVQADPIRSPARAQDLILRHRVTNYRAGDLDRRYKTLDVEEDVFVNYGFVTSELQKLMHPRSDSRVPADNIGSPWPSEQRKRAELLLGFIRQRGAAHPREVDEYFSHGKVTNYWGGSSNATTHLLDAMHYQGMLRVAKRENGIRIYTAHEHEAVPLSPAERQERIDALVDVVVNTYAPLPGPSLTFYVRRLRFAAPQYRHELTRALQRARKRLGHAKAEGVDWYWPEKERAIGHEPSDLVRLLAPFDPVVHDRWRFELLWGWTYRFEAYTPAAKRKMGYYAMPLVWRGHVIGWGNLSVKNDELKSDFGYVQRNPPRDRVFKRELDAELDRIRVFLGVH